MNDLVATARRLARATVRRPRQADLKRAVSTAYYALFHTLAAQCADLLVGAGTARGTNAWSQVYRALEHGFAKNACNQAAGLGFSPDIVNFAHTFAKLQDERHRADYDPATRYTRAEAQIFISEAERAIRSFKASRARTEGPLQSWCFCGDDRRSAAQSFSSLKLARNGCAG